MSHHCRFRWSSSPSHLLLNKRELLGESPAPLLRPRYWTVELTSIALHWCLQLTWFCESGVRWEDASGQELSTVHCTLYCRLSKIVVLYIALYSNTAHVQTKKGFHALHCAEGITILSWIDAQWKKTVWPYTNNNMPHNFLIQLYRMGDEHTG